MKKKVLIVGASGNLGQELMKRFAQEYNVSGTYLSKPSSGLIRLDMVNEGDTKKVIQEANPEIVIITAAKTNVQACESDPQDSFKINVKGVENIVRSCEGRRIIFYSTDGVFDGKKDIYHETDEPCPVNVYGKHKLEAESLVGRVSRSLIIRSSRYYGLVGGSGKYLNNVISALGEGKEIKAPVESEGNFTFIPDLINASLELVKGNKEGIYNVAGKDVHSLYDAAVEIARVFGFDKNLVQAVGKDYFNQTVKRPSCPLSLDKLSKEGINMKSLEEGLRMIKEFQNGR